jgi:hypothetical protein
MKRGKRVEVPPSKRLLYSVYVATGSLMSLVALEIAHIAFLGTWNNEIFAAITALIGTISGVFLSQKA